MKTISLTFLIILMGVFAYGAEFPICTAAGDQQHPDVVFDGTEYTVVYDSVGDIWGAKVSTEGTVSERFVIVDDVNNSDTYPSIAYDGTNFFIAWLKEDNIYGIMIDANNNVVVSPFLIPFTNAHRYPKVTFNGTYYLVVGCGIVLIPGGVAGQMFGITYNTDGTVYHSSFLIDNTSYISESSGSIGNPSVGSDNNRFIVAYPYRDCPPPGASTEHALKYKVVTADGQLPFSGTIKTVNDPNHTSHTIFYKYSSGVAYNSSEYFCSYHFSETASSSNGNYDVYGVRIDPTDGSIIQNNIQIAVQANVGEYASAVTANDNDWFVVWQDYRSGTDFNLYGRHANRNSEVIVCLASYNQEVPRVAFDGLNNLVVWQDYRSNTNWDIYGNLVPEWPITDDPLALAYNGNKHLQREPNTDNLHIVYTDNGKVIYKYSDDGGENWIIAERVGTGSFPAIDLDSQNNPCVTWTNGNSLFFSRRTSGWTTTEYPFETSQPTHPCLCVVPNEEVDADSGHILVRLYNDFTTNSITELRFFVTSPQNYQTRVVEQSTGPSMVVLDYPSVKEDYTSTLHAAWMYDDIVHYGYRTQLQSRWTVWTNPFPNNGDNSAHPFTEAYGDSIFVVWQNESDQEIYRGSRSLQNPNFPNRPNLSETPFTPSIYPVNASGLVTTFVDKSSGIAEYDIFWKTYPNTPLHNLSNNPLIQSMYPHTSLRVISEQEPPLQYTIWQHGNASPYEIKSAITIINPTPMPAYFITVPGVETPFLHLIKRDSYIANWSVPVDIGYETVIYQFPLLPDYQYKLQAVAYHEASGEWREWVVIDNHPQHLIKYDAFEPETLEFWIPPAFYQDSVIEVTIERVAGDFATAGPIYVYRYEDEECGGGSGGGPMAQHSHCLDNGSIVILPNPFRDRLNISYQTADNTRINMKIYDVSGRLVKQFDNLHSSINQIIWYGDDDTGRSVSQGIYFLQIENLKTKETCVHKVLKIE